MKKKVGIVLGLLVLATSTSAGNEDGHQTDLRTVLGYPQAYARMPFEAELLYGGPGDLYSPFYTVFEPSSYLNFKAWGDSDAVWTPEGYKEPHRFFFVNRDNRAAMNSLAKMAPHTWVRARCIVRSTFKDRAWIEVVGFTEVGHQLERETLKKMVRGWALWQQGEAARALVEMERVVVADMPRPFATRFSMDQSRVALEAGDLNGAMLALRRARGYDPKVPEVAQLVARIRAAQHDLQPDVAEVDAVVEEDPDAALQEWPDEVGPETENHGTEVETQPVEAELGVPVEEVTEPVDGPAEIDDGTEPTEETTDADEATESTADEECEVDWTTEWADDDETGTEVVDPVTEIPEEGIEWPDVTEWPHGTDGPDGTGTEETAGDETGAEEVTEHPEGTEETGTEETGTEPPDTTDGTDTSDEVVDCSDPSVDVTETAAESSTGSEGDDETLGEWEDLTESESEAEGEAETRGDESADEVGAPEGLEPPVRELPGADAPPPSGTGSEVSAPVEEVGVEVPPEIPLDLPPPPVVTEEQAGTDAPPVEESESTPPVEGDEDVEAGTETETGDESDPEVDEGSADDESEG